MNTNKTIKWGILGCGNIAHYFAQDLGSIPNAKLHAVASRNLQKAKDFGEKYDAPQAYGSYEELSKDNEIDVIYIATPHVFHHENTIMCLNNNKAVLCEKPFAMNISQVEEMISIAKEKQIFLMEALWTYFLPHYDHVLKLIGSKEFGNVKTVTADFGFAATFNPDGRLFNKKLGGGSLLDVGIYPLFAALSILGYPDKIEANATFGKTGVDETCTMKLEYSNGTSASLFSAISKDTNTEAIIEFEKATIKINTQFHKPSSITILKNGVSESFEFPVTTNGYNYEAIHVQNMLLQNRTESTIMTFDKSLQLIKMLDTVREKIGLQYS
ncbi:Gfo/Idh/MocA family protein [Aquimarina aggregata]|nr:Gfo/Idh/MocA family oxidoreductase [Aquimarina aggregata]